MATTSLNLNLLHLPFAKSRLSLPSRQTPNLISFKYQNTQKDNSLLICKGCNVEIPIDEDDEDEDIPIEFYVDIFERECQMAGIFPELMRRRFHENAAEKKKRKSNERSRAVARERRALRGFSNRGADFDSDDEEEEYDEDQDKADAILEKFLDPNREGDVESLYDLEIPAEFYEDDDEGVFPFPV